MRNSEIVEIGGVFVGVALRGSQAPECRFVALHDHVRDLDGSHAADTEQLRAQARALFRRKSVRDEGNWRPRIAFETVPFLAEKFLPA